MALVAPVAATAVALAVPAEARASIGGDGSTRGGAPPVVRLVVGAAQRLHAPRLHQGTFAYGRDAAQRFDAYWPDAASPGGRQPGILLLHGGYWSGGDKASWRGTARRLAARGYAVFSANYRLSTHASWPAQRDDAVAALDHIQRNAWRFQLDQNRMVVIGSSAGGQLATVLGVAGAGRIRGVVALSPVNSPYLAYVAGGRPGATMQQRKLRQAVTRLVRCRPAGPDAAGALAPRLPVDAAFCLGRIIQATPRVTTAAVPMLFLHSRGDFVPVGHSAPVRAALAAVGVTADMKLVSGSAHGGNLLHVHRSYRMVVAWIDAVTGEPAR